MKNDNHKYPLVDTYQEDYYTCPVCKSQATMVYEEVDIGVGVQRFFVGIFCPECEFISACPYCGRLEPEGHERFCTASMELYHD